MVAFYIVDSLQALALANYDPAAGNPSGARTIPLRLSTADEYAVPLTILTDPEVPEHKKRIVRGAPIRDIAPGEVVGRRTSDMQVVWDGELFFPQTDLAKECLEADPDTRLITFLGHKDIVGRAADTDGGVDRSRTELSHDVQLQRNVPLWTSFWFRQQAVDGPRMTEQSIFQIHQVDEPTDAHNLSPPLMVRQYFRESDGYISLQALYRSYSGRPTAMTEEAPTNYAIEIPNYPFEEWRHMLMRIVQGNQDDGEWHMWLNGQPLFALTGINNHFGTTTKLDYDKIGTYCSPASTTLLRAQYYDYYPLTTRSLAHQIGNPGPTPSPHL